MREAPSHLPSAATASGWRPADALAKQRCGTWKPELNWAGIVTRAEKTTLALSPDGQWVSSTHEPKEYAELNRTGKFIAGTKITPVPIKVWDASTGKERWSLLGHHVSAYRLAFSPDGRLLASAGYQSISIWDLAMGARLSEFNPKETIDGSENLVFSPDGKLLIIAGGNTVQSSDVKTGKRLALFQGHGVGSITGLAISPDQKRLATAASREVKIWDLLSGQEAVTLPVPESTQRIVALGWTTDGQRLRGAFSDASGG